MRIWIVLPGLLGCLAAQADTLWMQNGDRLSGHIEAIEEQQIRIALPYGAPLTVRRDAVKRWRLSKPAAAPRPQPVQPGALSVTSAPSVEPHWFWAGQGDLSVKLKRNDKRTDNIDFTGQVELADLDWRYTLEGKYLYETVDGITKTHKYRLKPMADYFQDQQWFWRSSIYYQYDLLAISYLSVDYGTGPGYRFWNDKRRRLEAVLQGGLSQSYWQEGNSGLNVIFNAHHASYPFASMGWEYRQPFWDGSTELFSDGSYTRYLDQVSPYVTLNQSLEASLGLRYYLNDFLSLSWRSEIEWDDVWLQWAGQKLVPDDNKEWRHLLSLGARF